MPQKITLVYEDKAGVQHALADYRGAYILLNIWASWCGPCVREMPSLDALALRVDPRKLVIVPLSEDHADQQVSVFYQTHAIKHLPVAIDQAGMATAALHLRGLPTTLLIDPTGYEVGRIEGDADWVSPDVTTFLTAHIR